MTPPPALLVVGHGTCDEAGAATLRSFVQMLGERNPGLPVGGGFTEENSSSAAGSAPGGLSGAGPGRFPGHDIPARLPGALPGQQPDHLAGHLPGSLSGAVAELVVRRAAREFAVIPLTLGRADQADAEIQRALEREEQRYDGIGYAYWRGPLGPHPALLSALERRLDEALGNAHRTPSDRAATTVLLVGRGSIDPEANAELYRTARLLWEGRGYASVEVAFVSQAAPDVPSGLDRCARLTSGVPGRITRVVVLPYFLFDGHLPDRARQQAEGWAEANSTVDVRFAGVIGAAEELADLVLERYGALPGARQDAPAHA
ncbi:sirohydrochlorin chelatase [Streptantibioticus silvisoli]|uniref:Sirohydrochlorin chelatase n=1 Tax=Streptantibioticus silvisoli TaxID=2705255 RepID=A0ABT6VZE1_9ACTN|nr:sirohydrochlorin chelatase [Streptantibioticus silvisoli]MDI5963107.1 sirohydrochlorin chelatase [Streptantibioticus silvisoli]